MAACVNVRVAGTPLKSKLAFFDAVATKHQVNQSVNPFSHAKITTLPKPQFSKDDYGRPIKGSLSEARGIKSTIKVYKEMLELCEVINQHGELLFTAEEKPDDPRKVISFGYLFDIYTIISDKVVGMLLRARKHKLLEFEGECLFQRRDDHVPIILLKSIAEIRQFFHDKISEAQATLIDSEINHLLL